MDCSGAFFSLMALGTCLSLLLPHVKPRTELAGKWLIRALIVAQNTFDVLGGVLYIIW